MDGALGASNPTIEALRMVKEVWNIDPDEINLLLSLGTGLRSPKVTSKFTVLTLMNSLINLTTDPSYITDQVEDLMRSNRKNYFRFSVVQGLESIAWDEWQKTAQIEAASRHYLQTSSVGVSAQDCAEQLSHTFLEKWQLLGVNSSPEILEKWSRAMKSRREHVLREIHVTNIKLRDLEAERQELDERLITRTV